jgi:transposase-like protein
MMRGTVIGEVAARYGLPVTVLSRWRGQYRDDAFLFPFRAAGKGRTAQGTQTDQ